MATRPDGEGPELAFDTLAVHAGAEPDELTGRLGSEICHPDDYDRVVEQFAAFLADPTRESMRTESRSRHKNGSWVWIDSIVRNHLDDPDLGCIVTSFLDIHVRVEAEHALRDSEARYRSVADASPIGIYEMDATPVLRFVNEQWQEITGFSEDDALDHNWQ